MISSQQGKKRRERNQLDASTAHNKDIVILKTILEEKSATCIGFLAVQNTQQGD